MSYRERKELRKASEYKQKRMKMEENERKFAKEQKEKYSKVSKP